jgi:hypothetical protein
MTDESATKYVLRANALVLLVLGCRHVAKTMCVPSFVVVSYLICCAKTEHPPKLELHFGAIDEALESASERLRLC